MKQISENIRLEILQKLKQEIFQTLMFFWAAFLVKHFYYIKKEGFSNETCGTLFFDIERILKEKCPHYVYARKC